MSSTLRWEHRTNLPQVQVGAMPVVGPKDGGALSDLPYHGNPMTKDKFGRIHLRYITPNPPLPPNVRLPGRIEMEKEKEEGFYGYALQPPRIEIALGPVTEPLFSGTEWTKPLKKFIDENYGDEFLSTVDGVVGAIGTMGAGKSTLALTLLGMLARRELFKEVHVVGPTVDIDSTHFDLNFERDPEVKFTFSRQIDVPWLEKKRDDMASFMAPYKRKAFIGKYTKKDAKNRMHEMFHRSNANFDSPEHPYQNADGSLHGRKPLLQQYIRKPSYLDDLPDAMGSARSSNTQHKKFKLANHFDARNDYYQSAAYQALYEKYNKFPVKTFQRPRVLDGTPVAQHINDMMTQMPSAVEHAIQAKLATDALKNPIGFKGHQEPEPSILFIEDGSYFLKGATESYIREWVLRIRHNRQMVIINFHKVTAMITPIRAVMTDLFLSRITNGKEVDVLSKEFGGKIADFKGKLNAATYPFPGRERDFCHINLLTGTVYRGFSGKLVPLQGPTA